MVGVMRSYPKLDLHLALDGGEWEGVLAIHVAS